MPTIAAVAAVVVLGLLSLFQLTLIFGAPLGRFAWGGRQDVLPAQLRVGSALSIVIYGLFALIILQGVDVVTAFSPVVAQVGIWVLVALFFGLFILNAASRSRYEQLTMTWVCLLLSALCLIVAIAGHIHD